MGKQVYLTNAERTYLIRELRRWKKVWGLWSRRRFPKTDAQPGRSEKVPEDARKAAKLELALIVPLLHKLRPHPVTPIIGRTTK